MDTLTGKTVFITGGAQGIGLGIAKACLKVGMRVVIADIKTEQLKVAESILDSPEMSSPSTLMCVIKRRWKPAADRTEATFEKVHVVCNNAGIGGGGPAVIGYMGKLAPDDGYEPARHTERIQVFVPRIARHGEGDTSSTPLPSQVSHNRGVAFRMGSAKPVSSH